MQHTAAACDASLRLLGKWHGRGPCCVSMPCVAVVDFYACSTAVLCSLVSLSMCAQQHVWPSVLCMQMGGVGICVYGIDQCNIILQHGSTMNSVRLCVSLVSACSWVNGSLCVQSPATRACPPSRSGPSQSAGMGGSSYMMHTADKWSSTSER